MIAITAVALLFALQSAAPAASAPQTNQPAAQQSSPAASQPEDASGIAKTMQDNIRYIAKEFISVADAMPEAKFSFVPTTGDFKTVRNFGQQVTHVADANLALADAVLGAARTKPATKPTSKAEIMAYIKDSFDELEKAAATVTAQNATEPKPNPFGRSESNRIGLLMNAVGHSRDHYGQLVVYLRMNGIIPPPSRK